MNARDRERCDPQVYRHGRVVCIITNPSGTAIEHWVGLLAFFTRSRTDWSWFGGRAVVKTLGDPVRVQRRAQRETWRLPGATWKWWEVGG